MEPIPLELPLQSPSSRPQRPRHEVQLDVVDAVDDDDGDRGRHVIIIDLAGE